MKKNLCVVLFSLGLFGCSQEPAGIRVVAEKPNVSSGPTAKTEPVFYNGKTYQVSLAPVADGATRVSISGMSATQSRDADGLAKSSFHHFACKDTQKAVIIQPRFINALWVTTAHCA